jgi:L-histidine N-alpha-methyltransferase
MLQYASRVHRQRISHHSVGGLSPPFIHFPVLKSAPHYIRRASNFETSSPHPERTVPPTVATLEVPGLSATTQAVAAEVRRGLTATPKCLAPWLFYDEAGSRLFEQITALPEYYLTRTERDLFATHADEIFNTLDANLTIAELGAGTASKTGILLRALTRTQPDVLYQPIDISPTALEEAHETIERSIPGVTVRPRVANYITDTVRIERPPNTRILALYIGSSIGNFSPVEAREILIRLRSELQPGDAILLGTDLAPSPTKSVPTLLAAYNDAQGVTAAFNRNILTRLNRELGANFRPDRFIHRALWNPTQTRIEMHLESLARQTATIPVNSSGPALTLHFAAGETIHTENSYKFTPDAISALLAASAFTPTRTFTDPRNLFAVTLATAF